MAYKPILTTGVAIVSAAAIVAATPALLTSPAPEVHVAAAPTVVAPLRQLSVADLQLMAAFTPQGLIDAIFNGYGGFVTGPEPKLPDPDVVPDPDSDPVILSFFGGATYYLADTLLFPTTSLDNHLFEQGLITGLLEFAREQGAPPVIIDLLEKPFRAPVILSEALLGPTNPVTQFLTALWDGGLVGVINFLIKGPTPPEDPEDATLLSNTKAGGVQSLDASLAPEAGTSAVGKFKAPDLTKLVSLPVKPQETVKDADAGDTLTVDATAGDTTEVQDPANEGGTVEEVKTEAPAVEVQDPASGAGTVEEVKTEDPQVEVQDPATEDNTVETVKTEKPKLNEKKVNPLADLNDKPVLPVTGNGSSDKPESGLTKAIKKFVGGLGKHKSEGTGTGAAAADGGGSESGGGDGE